MKKLLFLAAVACAALSCTSDDTADTTNPNGDDGSQSPDQEITIAVSTAGSDIASRVEFAADSDGDISITWADDDTLGAWESGATSFTKFTIDDSTLSTDGQTADFSGDIEGDEFRLIHPYTTSAISGDSFTLDLSTQTTDMAGDGFNNMSSTTYMISDVATSSSQPSMEHMAAAIKVAMQFENLATADLSIASITLGGGDGIDLPTAATVDLTSDVTASDFLTTKTEGSIKATVENSPIVAEYSSDEIYTVMLNALPFSINSGQSITLTVTLANESGSDTYTESFAITFDQDTTLDRATYTTLTCTCDMGAAAGSTLSAPVISALETSGTLALAEPIVWSATTGATYNVYLKVDGGSTTKIVSGWESTSYIIPNKYMSCDLTTGAYSYTVYVEAVTSSETFTSNSISFKPAMSGTITDTRGDETNTYGWVRVGPQVWLTDNLKTAYFNDGTPIPLMADQDLVEEGATDANMAEEYYDAELYGYDYLPKSSWGTLSGTQAANFKNWTYDQYIDKVGYAYSFWATASDKLAPEGWHPITYAEWESWYTYCLADEQYSSLGSGVSFYALGNVISSDYYGGRDTYGIGLSVAPLRENFVSAGDGHGFRTYWEYHGTYWLIKPANVESFLTGEITWSEFAANSADSTMGDYRLPYRFSLDYTGNSNQYWKIARNTWSIGYFFAVRCLMDDDLN